MVTTAEAVVHYFYNFTVLKLMSLLWFMVLILCILGTIEVYVWGYETPYIFVLARTIS